VAIATLTVTLLTALLTGCATEAQTRAEAPPPQAQPAATNANRGDQETCVGFGFRPGTPEIATCEQRVARDRQLNLGQQTLQPPTSQPAAQSTSRPTPMPAPKPPTP